jgi:ABC-2 type transport system ATP-binding protein
MKNVQKSFGKNHVLKGVTFDTHDGEIFGLLGPSGSGKTTIINILTKQFGVDGGECFVSVRSNEIGLMLEHDGLFSRLSCADNLHVFREIYGIPKNRVADVLEKVGLSDSKKTVADKLSKGMRQRLVIARAILHKPKILFMDEPTSALDPVTARGIYALIRELRDGGSTIFLTTHNMEEATNLCDRVVMLHDGKIIEQGDPKEICERYNSVKTVHDLESVFIQLTGGGFDMEPAIAAKGDVSK